MHLSEIWHSKKNDCRLSRTQVNKSNPNPNIVDQNKIKKKIRERPIRVKSVVSVFLFLICDPAVGWGHNGNTE